MMKKFYILGLITLLICACEDEPDENNNSNDYSDEEMNILDAVNSYREEQSLQTLEMNAVIWEEARKHSQLMADGDIPVGTDNIQERYQNIRNNIDQVIQLETNVAFRTYSANETLNYWLSFSSDDQTMKGEFNYTGIGVVYDDSETPYITQIFANIEEEEEE